MTCTSCGSAFARINGRTLNEELATAPGPHPWRQRRVGETEWFVFCPGCDAPALQSLAADLPYHSADGIMRTLVDAPTSPVLSLGLLRFTVDALRHAIRRGYINDPETATTEEIGRAYTANECPSEDESERFSRSVCGWGDPTGRVMGNLRRHHPGDKLKQVLHQWLPAVRTMSIPEALAAGMAVKGLNVSFATKHLRHLEPHRFATLDSVLNLGLGYAMNPAGYQLFLQHVAELQEKLGQLGETDPLFETPASIETGIFHLARQEVRADAVKVSPKLKQEREAERLRRARQRGLGGINPAPAP